VAILGLEVLNAHLGGFGCSLVDVFDAHFAQLASHRVIVVAATGKLLVLVGVALLDLAIATFDVFVVQLFVVQFFVIQLFVIQLFDFVYVLGVVAGVEVLELVASST
jgi:hypothetical protein